jgi:hypothetical protein
MIFKNRKHGIIGKLKMKKRGYFGLDAYKGIG